MNATEIVRGLEGLIERHKNDKYNSFETRWVDVITDCKSALQNLLTENNGLKRQLEAYMKEASDYSEKDIERELDVILDHTGGRDE